MKHIITFTFFFLLLSCTSKQAIQCIEANFNPASQVSDSRCDKIMDEAVKKGRASGYCYSGPPTKGLDPGGLDPDPEKCIDFYKEGDKKCDALPFDPKYLRPVSDPVIYQRIEERAYIDSKGWLCIHPPGSISAK